jgi:histidinol-phosphate/aromatic aminotransferase/cobyric acid decarboxylase-like protein
VLITKWPTMTEHIRISMGKPKEMERFVEVIGNFLA